jgi:membrane-bound hydrogenase subunit alpha
MTIGGVRRDIDEADFPKIKATLKTCERKFRLQETYPEQQIHTVTHGGVGLLSREDAQKLCVVGPVARGSGGDIECPKDVPYEA